MSVTPLRKQHQEPNAWLRACLEQILKPIVRLFLKRRVTFPALAEMAKKVYVDLAHEEAIKNDPRKRITISGLSIATGIDPASIKAHLNRGHEEIEAAASLSPESAVLAAWHGDPMFHKNGGAGAGTPIELPIYGSGRSFQTLVRRSTSSNVGYAEMLDKLLDSGNVAISDDGKRVIFKDRWYVTCSKNVQAMMQVTSKSIEHFLTTFNRNLAVAESGDEERFTFLQREIWTRKLPQPRVDDFRAEMKSMLSRQSKYSESKISPFEDSVPKSEHVEAGVGYYYFEIKPPED